MFNKEYHKNYHIKNRAKLIARSKEWIRNNRERFNKTANRYYWRNRDRAKLYYKRNRDRLLTISKERCWKMKELHATP